MPYWNVSMQTRLVRDKEPEPFPPNGITILHQAQFFRARPLTGPASMEEIQAILGVRIHNQIGKHLYLYILTDPMNNITDIIIKE